MQAAKNLYLLFDRYIAFMVVLTITIVYLDFAIYINLVNTSIEPKYIYFLIFGLATPMILANSRDFAKNIIDRFGFIMMLMLIINAIHYLTLDDLVLQSIIITREEIIILSTLIIFIITSRLDIYIKSIKLMALLLPALVIVDFCYPGFFYNHSDDIGVIGRAAATLINPNKAGEAMLLLLLLNTPLLTKQKLLGLTLLMGVAILLTFSRSAIFAWILFYVIFSWLRWLPTASSALISLVFIASISAIFSIFQAYLLDMEQLAPAMKNIQDRLDFFKGSNVEDDSTLSRMTVLKEGIDTFLQNSFTGQGAGSTDYSDLTLGSHNQLVLFASEYGIFGILIWLALVMIIACGNYTQLRYFQLLAAGTFVYLSFFTHNMFTFFYWLTSIGLLSSKIDINENNSAR